MNELAVPGAGGFLHGPGVAQTQDGSATAMDHGSMGHGAWVESGRPAKRTRCKVWTTEYDVRFAIRATERSGMKHGPGAVSGETGTGMVNKARAVRPLRRARSACLFRWLYP